MPETVSPKLSNIKLSQPTNPPLTNGSPPLSVQAHHISDKASNQPSEAESPHLLSQRNDFLLDWSLKIIGLAAAIVFGIWAPISYSLTAQGNRQNDASQADLQSQLEDVSEQASSASSLQAVATSILSNIQEALNAQGLLSIWEFCDGKAEQFSACTRLSSSDVDSAISSLASRPPAFTYSGSPTTAPSPGSSSSSSSMHLSIETIVAIVLGSIFGAIVLVGLVVGVLAARRKQKRMSRINEE